MTNQLKVDRKYSAVLFTDISGFTGIMSNNEEYAYQIIDKMRQLIIPIIEQQNGELIKQIGDGTLSIFTQSSDAINCAMEFQQSTYNIKDLNIRAGIHFGEIIKEEQDVFGDVVNIAKRLESLAKSGSVLVSRETIDNIELTKDFKFVPLGLQALKGVGRLIEVFALDNHNVYVPEIIDFQKTSIHVHDEKEVPSIAIIPFENKGAKDDIFYTYGISSDLISDISSAGAIRVTSMKNIDNLENYQNLNLEELASKLFVRYISTGTMWKMDDLFQLSIELYDTKNNYIVWSDRWQEKWKNLTEIKGKLSDGLLKSLSSERKVKVKRETLSSEAYEFYLKGKYKFEKRANKEDQEIAQLLLEKALELDKYLISARIELGKILNEAGQYSKAIELYFQAKKHAEELDDKIGISSALNNIGNIHLLQGEYGNAENIYNESLKIRTRINDKLGISGSLNNLGNLFRRKGEYKSALENYKKSLSIVEEIEDKSGIATALNNMGVMQRLNNDIEQSLLSYQKAYKIREQLEDQNGMALLLNNIGNIYFMQNELEKALTHYHQSLEVVRKTGNKIVIANSLNNEANIYFSMADYDTALDIYTESLNIRKNISDKHGIASSFINIGTIYSIFGNYNKALTCYTQSKDIRIWLNEKSGLVSSLLNIGKVNLRIFNYETALKNLERAQKIQIELDQTSTQLAETKLLKMVAEKFLDQESDNNLIEENIKLLKDPDYDFQYFIYLLAEDLSYLEQSYKNLMFQSEKLKPNLKNEFLSYPLNKQIISEYQKAFN